MQHRLPDWVDPLTLADKGRTFRAQVPLVSLARLAERLNDTEGELEVELSFGRDGLGTRFLKGSIVGQVQLTCERCLAAFSMPLQLDFELALLESEGLIDRIPAHYEPLLVEQGEIRPLEVIEDEVLLALPMFPVHTDEQDCHPYRPEQESPETDDPVGTDEARDNPFATLAKLKRNE